MWIVEVLSHCRYQVFTYVPDGILCHCNNCPGVEDDENGTCYLRPGGQCYSAVAEVYNVDENEFEPDRKFGCISDDDEALLLCKGDLIPSFYGHSVKCCNFTDLCNKDLFPHYKPRAHTSSPNSFFKDNSLFITLLGAFLFCILILFSYLTVLILK